MRLLEAATRKLSEFSDEQRRPPYVILSHTWGSEEITLQELNKFHENGGSDSLSSKAGFKKIEACCDQALRDGFKWVWIDTCCIDKTSSAELSEAINSMFAWYKKSSICYAFLSDVDNASSADELYQPGSSFRVSRWFQRGWTLQELLAPRQITFFNSNWQHIGELSRDAELSRLISEITNIPPAFLNGLDLESANAAMKMSWVSGRETSRKEDIAYCLLGIFNVHMPLLYGEGTRAFHRLQEEIMKQSYDHSLLAWGSLQEYKDYFPWDAPLCGILATSPAAFANYECLYSCPPSLSKDYQITNQGLRIQLALRSPRSPREKENRIYLATLDCYSSEDPSRRVAILLQKVAEQHSVLETTLEISKGSKVQDGETFVRVNQDLVFSDMALIDPPYGYGYFTKTIQIVLEKDLKIYKSQNAFHDLSIVEFPSHYRYDMLYVHNMVELQDFRTGDMRSLRVKLRGSPSSNSLLVSRRSSATSQLIEESAQLGQSSSFVACVRFTRQSQFSRPGESESFLASFAETQVPGWKDRSRDSRIRWRLSPSVEQLPQEISDLRGHNSLRLAHETLVVRDFTVPAGPNNHNWTTLSKIEVKESIFPRRKAWNTSLLWGFGQTCAWFVYRNGYTIGVLVVYALIVTVLATLTLEMNMLSLCVAMWTLYFMPVVYDIRREDGGGSHIDIYEGLILRLCLVVIGVYVITLCALFS